MKHVNFNLSRLSMIMLSLSSVYSMNDLMGLSLMRLELGDMGVFHYALKAIFHPDTLPFINIFILPSINGEKLFLYKKI